MRGALHFSQLLKPNEGQEHRWKFRDCFGYVVDRSLLFSEPQPEVSAGGQGVFYTAPSPSQLAELIDAKLVALIPGAGGTL